MSIKDDISLHSKRSSAGELIRLVCMLMIVMHHFITHSVFKGCGDLSVPLSLYNGVATLLNSFVFIGVNCFILLSGYYGIHLNWKRMLNLYLMCAFYGLIGYLIHLGVDHQNVGGSIIYNSLFIFSHSSWWYITCYLMLFLMSPLLNKAIDHFTQKEHAITIGLFTIANVYFGYLWQTKGCNIDGYTVAQFVYIYIIGRYIKLYGSSHLQRMRWRICTLYIVCSFAWAGLTMASFTHQIPFWYPYSYNNPLVLLGSIAFFCFMMSFQFESKVVNWLAASCLAVYLIQDQAYLGHGIIHPFVRDIVVDSDIFTRVLAVFGLSVLFMLSALLVDKIRIVLMKPITRYLAKYE